MFIILNRSLLSYYSVSIPHNPEKSKRKDHLFFFFFAQPPPILEKKIAIITTIAAGGLFLQSVNGETPTIYQNVVFGASSSYLLFKKNNRPI